MWYDYLGWCYSKLFSQGLLSVVSQRLIYLFLNKLYIALTGKCEMYTCLIFLSLLLVFEVFQLCDAEKLKAVYSYKKGNPFYVLGIMYTYKQNMFVTCIWNKFLLDRDLQCLLKRSSHGMIIEEHLFFLIWPLARRNLESSLLHAIHLLA